MKLLSKVAELFRTRKPALPVTQLPPPPEHVALTQETHTVPPDLAKELILAALALRPSQPASRRTLSPRVMPRVATPELESAEAKLKSARALDQKERKAKAEEKRARKLNTHGCKPTCAVQAPHPALTCGKS
jgi:hypothetical protein